MAGSELKNCQPKLVRCGCGGEAKVEWANGYDPFTEKRIPNLWYGVICKKCKIQTKSYYTEAEAIQAWNTAMSGNTKEKLKAFWDGISAEMKEERKKGKWQRRKGSDCWECSKCHAVLESDDIVRHNFYYCYHCGADMMNEDGYMKLEGTEHE